MTTAASAPTRAEALALLRSLLRAAAKFPDYNVREYMKRRTLDAFRSNRGLDDPSAAATALADGRAQLEVARRQAVVYSLYVPKVRSVMEMSSL